MHNFIMIKSIGRSGSHIVRKYLIENNFKDQVYHVELPVIYNKEQWQNVEKCIKKYDTVVHTHSVYIPNNSKDWICVFVERKSMFDLICSRLIVEKTKEYTNYDNITLDPFVADIKKFIYHFYNEQKRLSRMTDYVYNATWKKLIHLYYEDIINKNYLQKQLPYIGNYKKLQYCNFQKSPFAAKHYIINYDLLLNKYNKLPKNYLHRDSNAIL